MKITSAQMLAHTLRNERKKRNQSQTADSVGLKQAAVSAFENNPDGTRLEASFKLLAALELELQVTPSGKPIDPKTWDQEW